MLKADAITRRKHRKAIDAVIGSGAHLKKVINDVLDISKIEEQRLDAERIRVETSGLLSDIYV